MKKNILITTASILLCSLTAFAQTNTNQKVISIAKSSACASFSWQKRGRAPASYVNGVALGFARSLCRLKAAAPSGLVKIMSQPDTHLDRKDALTHYQNIFSNLGIRTSQGGEENLKAVYTLGLGLGMRESSGKYCEGWDVSAGTKRQSSEAESGPFQVSSNSMGASPELKKLYQEYQASPSRCLLEVFSPGVKCKAQSILGTGAGADFQVFNKSCPAFATEYAMTLLRILRAHFGPINRLEAQVTPVCENMLTQVQQVIDADPATACREIN